MPDTPPQSQPTIEGPTEPDHSERQFLAGPRDRGTEFMRVIRIAWEFIRGFRALHFEGPCVTVFGSSRVSEGEPDYEMAREVGRQLARAGFTVMTGGGPGIMEAGNRGAFEAGRRSVGLNITLPGEQYPNPYITPELCLQFHYFGLRKLHFLKRARALVAFPGGYGTLDELSDALCLVQTRKIPPMPIILVGEAFWRRVLDVPFLVEEGMITPEDAEILQYAESAAEIWRTIRDWHRD